VFNVLLQVLDDGRLTDSQGRTIDFKNAVLIMTSNIGSTHLLEDEDDDGEISDATRSRVMSDLRRAFRPEFLNRVDEIVLFKRLRLDEIEQIVELLLVELRKRLTDRRVTLELSEDARRFVAREAFDPVYGARPLKRYLQKKLETGLARRIVQGDIADGSRVIVDLGPGNGREGTPFTFTVEAPAATDPAAEPTAASA
jgi:ATP-dependent Clp protease ATP-binding subunit ClpB